MYQSARRRTAHPARECDEHIECPCIILYICIRLERFENADHDEENDNPARGADDERNIRDAIARHGFNPFLTSSSEAWIAGRFRARPGNAAPQNVIEH
jgi:hypothetical protein